MFYLIRYGELVLKSRKVRKRFLSQLEENLRVGLARKGIFYRLSVDWSRAFLESDDPRAGLVLSRCFGISSFSRADRMDFADLEELVEKGAGFFGEVVAGKRFAVRAKRRGSHTFSSKDIENELGARLLPRSSGVDLDHPEITCYLEVRGADAWFFTEKTRGPGGLPVGTGKRVLALYSGGFDSGVAAWMMMKKSSPVDFLFLNIGGTEHKRKARQGASFLVEEWAGATGGLFYEVDFSNIIREIKDKVNRSYWNMALKRCFYLAAWEIARRKNYPAVVTGESLGQVSSQTLTNLVALEDGATVPVMRPLLGLDKEEIIEIARKTGTYSISDGLREYCDLAGGHPITSSNATRLEARMCDLRPGLLEEALSTLEITRLPAPPEDAEDVETDQIPDGALLVDLREVAKYQAWHQEGALLAGYDEIEAGIFPLEKGKVYIFYCDQALKSLDAARVLRRMGFEAYSFKGGTNALMKQVGKK